VPFRRASWDHEVARWAYIIIVIASAVAMAVLFVMISNDRSLLNREANIRATQIQQQRYDNIYGTCVDQNHRYNRAIRRLQKIAMKYIKAHPETKVQVKASIKQQKLLISAIVPFQNCRVVAKKAVHPLANPNGR
jgi:hypothetical protein